MKWIVLGSKGQLGSTLVRILQTKGENVVGLSQSEVDITKPSSLGVVERLCPDILVNCAALSNVDLAEEIPSKALLINGEGARNVAVVAKKSKTLLIHLSTDYVFSGEGMIPWKTSDVPRPINKYGLSKYVGEQFVQDIYPEKSLILRTAWLYSMEGSNFVKKILKKIISKEKTIEVVNDQVGQPTSAISLCEQIYLISKSQVSSGILHATNSGQVSRFDFARQIMQLTNSKDSEITPVLMEDWPTKAKRPRFLVLDHNQWDTLGIKAMCDWQTALENALPEIYSRVTREMQIGKL